MTEHYQDNNSTRLAWKAEDKKVLALMMGIFCKGRHSKDDQLCNECSELLRYAEEKLDKCPFKNKPNCSDCKIHCYDAYERDKIRDIMRYSGKRMIVKHPLKTIAHYMRKLILK